MDNFQQLTDSQKYALASAIYAYDTTLQFKNPSDDMVAPVAYTEYGKTISHYGGLRIAPHHAIE